MESILDLSELCRLCLEQTPILIPLQTRGLIPVKSTESLALAIRFCLDIECDVKDNGILPKNVCQNCLDSLKVAFDLKTKSKETEKYLKEILQSQSCNDEVDGSNDEAYAEEIIAYNPPPSLANFNRNFADDADLLEEQPSYNEQANGSGRSRGSEIHTCNICGKVFKYVKPFRNHMRQQHGLKSGHNPPPVQKNVVEDEPSDQSLDAFLPNVKGKNSGEFSCPVCNKEFKYIKPLKGHMKLHNNGGVTKKGNKRRNRFTNPSPAKSTYVPASTERQPPYDSRSPYREEIQFPQHSPAQSNRDSSPDFASTLLSTTFNDDFLPAEPPQKRLRTSRKQKSPSRSPTPEKPPAPTVSKRGRKPKEAAEKKEATEELPSLFDGFSEVDINSVLKSKAFSFVGEDSQSQSGPTSRSRSSSIESVELVPEFDIFGGPSIDVLDSPAKKIPEKAFSCDARGCNLKFNLKANLKRHQREVHHK